MKTIAVMVFDGVEILDATGPASVFTNNDELRERHYRLVLTSPEGGPVRTSAGVVLANTLPLENCSGVDTLIVAGGSRSDMLQLMAGKTPAWLREQAASVRRVASVCTGAFLLGAAGLLDGRRATTHWSATDDLQRLFPKAKVDPDAIYIFDGVYSSAGVTAGIDLALALVTEDHGHKVAADIARELVVFLRRSGGQSQYSRILASQARASAPIAGVVQWIAENLTADLSVTDLAFQAGMSERTFARAFTRETGMTPAKFVSRARMERAQALLEESAWPLERIVERTGFGSVDALQRAFRSTLQTTPVEHRRRFSTKRDEASNIAPKDRSVPACA